MAKRGQKAKTTVHKKHPSGAEAIQVDTRDGSVVSLGKLRVLITKTDKAWVAQGLEIDYAIDGKSFADAKARFQDGLARTVASHLRVYKSIENLLSGVPKELWDEFYASRNTLRRFEHSQISVHQLQQYLPFDEFVFYERDRVAS
jgi:hypothetical protein